MFQDDLLAELEELEQEELDKNLLDIKGTENVPLPSVPSTSLPARPGIKCCYVQLCVLMDLICFPVWVAAYSPFMLPSGAIKQLHNCCSCGYISVYPTKQTAIICLQIQQIEFQAPRSGPAVVCPLQESFLTAGVSCCMFQLVGAALVTLYNDIRTVFCTSSAAAKTAEWKRQDNQTVAAYV